MVTLSVRAASHRTTTIYIHFYGSVVSTRHPIQKDLIQLFNHRKVNSILSLKFTFTLFEEKKDQFKVD